MSIIAALLRAFTGHSPDPVELDIAPTVKVMPELKRVNVGTTLEEAHRRHGRQFRAQSQVGRSEPPSETLKRLNRLSDAAASKDYRRNQYSQQEMTPTHANNAIAADNIDAERGAKWFLFPKGFAYRPPVDQVCPGCGAKHTDGGIYCSTCRADDSRKPYGGIIA